MSRVGNDPINIKDVEVEIDNLTMIVKGKRGEIKVKLFDFFDYNIEDGVLKVTSSSSDRKIKEKHGLIRSLINNAVYGVSIGYTHNLFLQGIGYRVQKKASNLEFSLGYSHPIVFKCPDGVEFNVESQDKFSITSNSKQLLGQVSADIKKLPPKDSYKGKGIFFVGETIRKKPGKSVK